MRPCMDKKEAVDAMIQIMDIDDKEFYARSFKTDIPKFIPTLGIQIFKTFDMKNNKPLLKDCCGEQNQNPENATYSIMVELWERLQ